MIRRPAYRTPAVLVVALALAPLAAGEGLGDKFVELRERFEQGAPESKDFEIEEKEANDFLKQQGAAGLAEGIENPWVRFEDSFAIVGATVDLEKVRPALPDSMLFQLLSGRVPVEVTARFSGDGGVGELQVERVLLSGVELPLTVVEMLTSDVKQVPFLPEGFRLGEPFALPYNVESVKLQAGAVKLRQRPTLLDK